MSVQELEKKLSYYIEGTNGLKPYLTEQSLKDLKGILDELKGILSDSEWDKQIGRKYQCFTSEINFKLGEYEAGTSPNQAKPQAPQPVAQPVKVETPTITPISTPGTTPPTSTPGSTVSTPATTPASSRPGTPEPKETPKTPQELETAKYDLSKKTLKEWWEEGKISQEKYDFLSEWLDEKAIFDLADINAKYWELKDSD
jgi:hypothetical protein